jgi:hypothetical protein
MFKRSKTYAALAPLAALACISFANPAAAGWCQVDVTVVKVAISQSLQGDAPLNSANPADNKRAYGAILLQVRDAQGALTNYTSAYSDDMWRPTGQALLQLATTAYLTGSPVSVGVADGGSCSSSSQKTSTFGGGFWVSGLSEISFN